MNTEYIADKKDTKMVAHRGLSGIERENTLLAFVAAGNRSYWGIECDVHVTKDGKYIVYHDDRTNRQCDRDLALEESTEAEIRSLRVRESGKDTFTDSLKLPYLSEYIDVCARYGKTAVVELKNPMAPEHIANIVRICEEGYDLSDVVFISFCFENLVEVRKIKPRQAMQFLCGEYTDDLLPRLKEHGFGLDIYYKSLTKERVSDLHKAGIRVNCWTCDDRAEAEELLSWGVDYITTNILE